MEHLKLTPADGVLLDDLTRYRRLVGRLIYLTVTRLDIVYSVQILSQFMQQPRKPHLDAALRVLRFIKGTPGQGLLFPANNNLALIAYCDSDHAGCLQQESQLQGIVYFLVVLLFLGNLRNNQMLQNQRQKQNIAPWQPRAWR
jgi:hypothetical protein